MQRDSVHAPVGMRMDFHMCGPPGIDGAARARVDRARPERIQLGEWELAAHGVGVCCCCGLLPADFFLASLALALSSGTPVSSLKSSQAPKF